MLIYAECSALLDANVDAVFEECVASVLALHSKRASSDPQEDGTENEDDSGEDPAPASTPFFTTPGRGFFPRRVPQRPPP